MSIFLKIIEGEIPSYKIAESDEFLAFLDVYPLAYGHVLIIPKTPIDKFYEIPNELIGKWMQFAKPIAEAIDKAFDCKRVGMTIIGLEVPHAHMHLLPINHVDDMNFTKPKLKLTPKEFIQIQEAIKAQLDK